MSIQGGCGENSHLISGKAGKQKPLYKHLVNDRDGKEVP